MHQIREEDLQLDRVPQPPPGAAKDPIYKLLPQLAEGGFNALAHLTEEEFMLWDPVPGNQQHRGLFCQVVSALGPPIPPIAQRDTTPQQFDQRQGWVALIGVGRSQNDIEQPPANMPQQMQL